MTDKTATFTELYMSRYLLAGLAMLASASGLGAQQRATPVQPTVIRNATVLTVTQGTLESTDVLLENGRIARIGRNVQAPSGARIVDGTGKYLLPGIIDAHSHAMSDAINEGSLSVTSMTRIQDVLNPTAGNLYRILAGGVTTLHILHGSANSIGGQNAVVKLKFGRSLDEMMFPGAMPGIKFALGENPKRASRAPQRGETARYPATRMGVEAVIRDAFTRARDYKRDWDEYRAAVARRDARAVPPRRDLELEPLVEIIEGKRWVHAHSYRSDEILMLLQLADEFGFRIRTLQHVLEGFKVASEIAAHGAMASTFADNWSYKIEAYDAIPHNAAVMTSHGVVVSLNSDSDERARRMNIEAAKMVKYGGLSDDEALKLVTYNPALQLGIQDRVGSIEVGKDADVVLWSQHPLSVYAVAEMTFIDGEVFFDRSQEATRLARLEQERRELEQAEPNRGPAPAAARGAGSNRQGGSR
ncbi:MAG TPA: amidohydrolase [Gemmatimonadaceae bacterium]|nr:amidohydrolase [Gemmatimonadaceae bacterium]